MESAEVIALVSVVVAVLSVGVSAAVAIIVPRLAFRFAVRQEQTRWLREQRAQLYVDLLTEAYAEQQHLEYDIADDDTRARMSAYYQDLRLPAPERARLGARGTIYGSPEVNRLFNELEAIGFRALLPPPRHEGDRLTTKVKMGGALDALQSAIRDELGADNIPIADSSQ